tara:strand:+ start:212 stop:448 length:237 start_codon:yes stop_codon:yes gene_type:complete
MMAPSRREKLGHLLEEKFNNVSEVSDSDRAKHFSKSNSYERALTVCPIDDELLWIDFAECLTELEQTEIAKLCQNRPS